MNAGGRGGAVLLTGGTGFVGSHMARALAARGHDVRCTVRATSDTRWLEPLELETVELDLARERGVEGALRGIAAVVHAGGLTRARDEAEFRRVNAGGTERLATAAAKAGVRRFVFISSLAARGPDGADGPVSSYGRSKAEAERRLARLSDRLELAVLRPGGVYGPRDSDLLPLFRMAARGLLVVPRSAAPLQPVFVEDVARAAVRALEAPPPARPLPVAERGRYAWPEVARLLARALGGRVRTVRAPSALFWAVGFASELAARLTGEPPAMDRRRARDLSRHSWTCDPAPTEGALDWRARVALPEGLERTAAWYREAGWL